MITKLTASHTLIEIQSIDEQNYFLDQRQNDERRRVAIAAIYKDILYSENAEVRSCIDIKVHHTDVQFHKILKAEAYMIPPEDVKYILGVLQDLCDSLSINQTTKIKEIFKNVNSGQ